MRMAGCRPDAHLAQLFLSMKAAHDCDVLIIGGGPAGSTMATLTARQGRRVVLLEKDHHPRFHIGESLLPGNVELFDRLGVKDQVADIGMPKFGIEFVPPDLDDRSYVDFSEGWDPSKDSAWQVRRSELDELLFRHAGKQGALTLEGAKVRQVDFDADGAVVRAVLAEGETRSWRTKFVVDASGRDTLLANKFKSKQKNPDHNSTALFGHFRNARRLEGSARATSASVGSSTAGSGSYRWPTARRASARSVGRTT